VPVHRKRFDSELRILDWFEILDRAVAEFGRWCSLECAIRRACARSNYLWMSWRKLSEVGGFI
jgi:hypothetical protein